MLKYYDELLYFVQKLIGDKDNAKDVIQETYSRILETQNKTSIKNERAYLYKTAKNVVVDDVIKKQKNKSTRYEQIIHNTSNIEQPDEIVINQQQEEIYLEVINNLPNRARQAYVLFSIDGYTRKEIGKIMGISSNAVEKLIKRATLKIEEELSKKKGFF